MKKVLVEFNFKGLTTQEFDKMWEECRAGGYANPKGLIQHTAAKTAEGIKVVDVWETEDAFTQFGKFLGPIAAKHGQGSAKPKVDPVFFEYVSTKKKELSGVH